MPRHVVLVEGDHRLPLDLENPVFVDLLFQRTRARGHLLVTEQLPALDDRSVTGARGAYAHELVLPLHVTPDRRRRERAGPVAEGHRSFPPGSEWLYFRVFAGPNDAERLLRELVTPLLDAHRGAFARWFFLRYGDPAWHLRIRIQGEPAALASAVRPAFEAELARAVAAGLVSRFELATYEPEVERYGGSSGIARCEAIFAHDSDAVMRLLPDLAADPTDSVHWRLAVRGLDGLLDAFGLAPASRIALLRAQRDALRAEAGYDVEALRRLGAMYRARAGELARALDRDPAADPGRSEAWTALAERDLRIRPIAAELVAETPEPALTRVILGITHMHVNRLFVRGHRDKELVLYDWLQRAYAARAARTETRTP
jgi:thiopeptide-type bacteriocin biosynthesis protein